MTAEANINVSIINIDTNESQPTSKTNPINIGSSHIGGLKKELGSLAVHHSWCHANYTGCPSHYNQSDI